MLDITTAQEIKKFGSEHQPPTLLTVRQFSDKHPAFPQGSLRNLIFNAENRQTSKGMVKGNGLEIALIRIGKKILIDEAKFFAWIDAQQKNKNYSAGGAE